jgi:hypothetical protein
MKFHSLMFFLSWADIVIIFLSPIFYTKQCVIVTGKWHMKVRKFHIRSYHKKEENCGSNHFQSRHSPVPSALF